MPTTIFALSSGPPPCGIAVVRVSGPAAFPALESLTRKRLPPLRVASLRQLFDPADGGLIDNALVLRFAAPASVTGFDVVELHLHGGTAVVAATLRVLSALPEMTLATPGAFTRQAFDNHKLDLTQVEGLGDLIGAETEGQRLQALTQAGGKLRTAVEGWRSTLLDLLAVIEAHLDFSDEVDDGTDVVRLIRSRLDPLRNSIVTALANGLRGERLRSGLTVALVGPPNVGKSSLLNALAGSDVAIVAPTPGTTRDAIEVRCDFAGVPVTIVDTAGQRDSDDPVEREGIRRAMLRADAADLVLTVGDQLDSATGSVSILNKIDRSNDLAGRRDGVFYVSATTGAGMDVLADWLATWAREFARPDEPALVSQQRHRVALTAGLGELERLELTPDPVIIAEGLRRSARALAAISGWISAEDILGAVFSRFCIGK